VAWFFQQEAASTFIERSCLGEVILPGEGLMLLLGLLFVRSIAEPALCLLWGYAIIYFAMNGTSFLIFNRLPDISYGVYLYAWPINKMVLWHYSEINVYVAMGIVLLLSICAGLIGSYLIEQPFVRLKSPIYQRKIQYSQ
jgi:peptidoglycan/LPS O-acetylase OafA/YrhL